MNRNSLTGEIVAAAIDVHRVLGPGLLESAYEACMDFELSGRGLQIHRQLEMPIVYKGKRINAGYRIDLLVNEKVIVELMQSLCALCVSVVNNYTTIAAMARP